MGKQCRFLGLLLAACMLCSLLPMTVLAVEADGETTEPMITHVPTFENTYVNTGVQRMDILGVAQTQLGFTEGPNNDNPYGSWYNMPNQPWCAIFVTWCARQAGVPESILPRAASIWILRSTMGYVRGSNYTPQPGDLFTTADFSHTGLVWYVDGEYFYTIEGNGSGNFSNDGYYVISVKRRIDTHCFICPQYNGDGEEHSYVLKTEEAHPHKQYYECTHCGATHETGHKAMDTSCRSCMSGLSTEKAGYYLNNKDYMPIRSGPGTSYSQIGGVHQGDTVYVYGVKSGWAYLEYDTLRGYVALSRLDPYMSAPDAPASQIDKQDYRVDETVSVSWEAVERNENFRLRLFRDKTLIRDLDLGLATTYDAGLLSPGAYSLLLTAANRTGASPVAELTFTVRDTFDITYQTGEGGPVPESQKKKFSQALELRSDIPLREGYVFLGWDTDPDARFAHYAPGDLFYLDDDTVLYAVWRTAEAVPETLSILTPPRRTLFVQGEALDTTGLTLQMTYSDGTARSIRQLPELEGYDSQSLGTVEVSASVEDLGVSYTVRIVTHIPGDFTKDGFVTEQDAIYLLRHVLFQEQFPIQIPGDFTGDQKVSEQDAIFLLRHVLFPEQYELIETEG